MLFYFWALEYFYCCAIGEFYLFDDFGGANSCWAHGAGWKYCFELTSGGGVYCEPFACWEEFI